MLTWQLAVEREHILTNAHLWAFERHTLGKYRKVLMNILNRDLPWGYHIRKNLLRNLAVVLTLLHAMVIACHNPCVRCEPSHNWA